MVFKWMAANTLAWALACGTVLRFAKFPYFGHQPGWLAWRRAFPLELHGAPSSGALSGWLFDTRGECRPGGSWVFVSVR